MVVTAAKLIRRRGYSGIAVSEMLRQAKVPKGSLYYHFAGGKEELGVAAIERSGRAVTQAIESVLADGEGDLAGALSAMATILADNLRRSGWFDGCPLATVALEESAQSEPIAAACRRVLDSWLVPLTSAYIAGGVTRRTARDEATFVIAAFEGALLIARVQHNTRPLFTAADRLAQRWHQCVNSSNPKPAEQEQPGHRSPTRPRTARKASRR